MSVEVRKTETEYHETGVGQENRVDVTYTLGATIDGAWVPFFSVPESKVEAAKAAAEAQKANAKAAKSNGT